MGLLVDDWWTRSTAAKSFSSAMIVGFGSGKDLRDYWEDFNLGQGLSIHTVYMLLLLFCIVNFRVLENNIDIKSIFLCTPKNISDWKYKTHEIFLS